MTNADKHSFGVKSGRHIYKVLSNSKKFFFKISPLDRGQAGIVVNEVWSNQKTWQSTNHTSSYRLLGQSYPKVQSTRSQLLSGTTPSCPGGSHGRSRVHPHRQVQLRLLDNPNTRGLCGEHHFHISYISPISPISPISKAFCVAEVSFHRLTGKRIRPQSAEWSDEPTVDTQTSTDSDSTHHDHLSQGYGLPVGRRTKMSK